MGPTISRQPCQQQAKVPNPTGRHVLEDEESFVDSSRMVCGGRVFSLVREGSVRVEEVISAGGYTSRRNEKHEKVIYIGIRDGRASG